jgi:hypothetical protein
VPSVHPRCHQHGLVAPDGMCVLCRKQASSGPPPQQQAEPVVMPPRAAEAAPESTDKYAALLVGVALVTMAATYLLDTTKVKELTASHAQTQRSEAQREEDAEAARLQELVLAATQAEDQQEIAAAAHDQAAPELDPRNDEDDEPQ